MAACVNENAPNEVLDENNDPGAAPFGNFINYYTFNPPENRLSLIPQTLIHDLGYKASRETILLLDVGCNSGVSWLALHLLKTGLCFFMRPLY